EGGGFGVGRQRGGDGYNDGGAWVVSRWCWLRLDSSRRGGGGKTRVRASEYDERGSSSLSLQKYQKGTKCDVRDRNDVKNLVKYAHDDLKNVDIWVLTMPHKLERSKAPPEDSDVMRVEQSNEYDLQNPVFSKW
ncbi:hypothetical protein Tco_0731217, partial [Tanacetum coccineum]